MLFSLALVGASLVGGVGASAIGDADARQDTVTLTVTVVDQGGEPAR